MNDEIESIQVYDGHGNAPKGPPPPKPQPPPLQDEMQAMHAAMQEVRKQADEMRQHAHAMRKMRPVEGITDIRTIFVGVGILAVSLTTIGGAIYWFTR